MITALPRVLTDREWGAPPRDASGTRVPLVSRAEVTGRGLDALPAPQGRPSRLQDPKVTRVPSVHKHNQP